MNTYELEIHFDARYLPDASTIHQHVDCDETTLLEHLGKITTQGVLIHVGDKKRFIPHHVVTYIDVTVLERVHIFHDVNESIKSVLTEE